MTDTSTLDFLAPVSFSRAAVDPDGFARDLGRSFKDTGFAVISDHPVDQGVIDRALEDTKAFFALPDDVKRGYFATEYAGQRGYTPFGAENAKGMATKDLKEFWHRGRTLPEGHPYREIMPDNVSVTDIERFDESTTALFDAFDEMGARAGAHEDINVITLLLGAEEAGLEVKTKTGEWIAVQPPKGALVVNIGDMLQRLTNNVLPSTTHRVVNPSKERMKFARYSTPFFLHFNPDFLIETLPGCISADHPNRYPEPMTAHAYLEERLREIGLM